MPPAVQLPTHTCSRVALPKQVQLSISHFAPKHHWGSTLCTFLLSPSPLPGPPKATPAAWCHRPLPGPNPHKKPNPSTRPLPPHTCCSSEYGSLARSYRLCMLMTHFFRQYLMYVTFEVLEPLWRAFQAKVQTAESLDEVSHVLTNWLAF